MAGFRIILLLLIEISCFGQLSNIQENYIYNYSTIVDSIDNVNGYPRQDALNYIINDSVNSIYINRVAEKYLKDIILDTLQLPVMKIPFDSINSDTALKNKVENQINNHNWNFYLKNNNVWLFNYNTIKTRNYKATHLIALDDIGGKAFNFEMYMYVPYARMGNSYDGFTVRQICNTSELILKRKDTGLIIIRLRRKNGDYFTWTDMLGMNDSWWTLTSYYEIEDMLDSIDICIVSDVDEDTTGYVPLESIP